MISKLFSRNKVQSSARIPEGRRIYAIGDIHGQLGLLEALLELIRRDDENRSGAAGELIFLGDLIDRGPGSAQVVDCLLRLREVRPHTRFLLGNHEDVFLSALGGDLKALRHFTRMGGRETMISYGVTPEAYRTADFHELSVMLQAVVPLEHRAFLESFEHMIVAGDYIFVHAGVRPNVPLDEQKLSDLLWIRQEFLQSRSPSSKIVVHGHSVEEGVVELPQRIGLDTGAYRSGMLTAMGFEGTRRWVIQERQPNESAGSPTGL